MTDEQASPAEQIGRYLEDLNRMREQIADVDIPGWTIGQPSVSELTEDLVIMVARSKGHDHIPFFPPANTEVVVAVLEGSVRIESGNTSTLVGRKFFVLSAAQDGRAIIPLEHPTRIYCTFFRTGAAAGEQRAMVSG
jgi:hypothetical protein